MPEKCWTTGRVELPDPALAAEAHERADMIAEVLSTLTVREQMIIRMRYGLDGPVYSLKEVGLRFLVTRERIRNIQFHAEQKIKRRLSARAPEDFPA